MRPRQEIAIDQDQTCLNKEFRMPLKNKMLIVKGVSGGTGAAAALLYARDATRSVVKAIKTVRQIQLVD
jgi:hypothetical protein